MKSKQCGPPTMAHGGGASAGQNPASSLAGCEGPGAGEHVGPDVVGGGPSTATSGRQRWRAAVTALQ